ncbi:BamA/TamA family outer membrane protein [Colwellia sp. E2M01]|uniref:BamA/TamA family outer membrane protein n=1 Tax=Colwellia sp. E2M01 TaxID=2841561 RepID=UPI001C085A47|nr:BamA/TamA family outer membrane protein [Colwellia sp. E2M01]MBU2871455.1 BamA/TamA family outer membrane protein [Colwellia sp. E2M01]
MNLLSKISSTILMSLYSMSSIAASDLFFDKLDGNLDASQYLSENAYGFLPVPIIITDPAFGGGLGMTGLFFQETEEEKNSRLAAMQDESNENAVKNLLPPSITAAFGAYTGNGSYFGGGGHLGFYDQGRIRYKGGAGYGDIHLDFYGFGDIELPKAVEVNTQAYGVMQSLKFKLADSPFYAGVLQRYINADLSAGNLDFLSGNVPSWFEEQLRSLLSTNTVTSGVGLSLEYDARDSYFSPTQGFKFELNYLWFDDIIGSDIDYTLTEFTALNYFKFNEQWRTGLKIEANYANSDKILPPYATPSISLRGMPGSRYQGQAVAMSELEVAYRVNVRWELSVFAGVGKASDSFSEFSESHSRISKGVGFRYLIARRYNFNMGIDIAKGPEDTIFYIQSGSTW